MCTKLCFQVLCLLQFLKIDLLNEDPQGIHVELPFGRLRGKDNGYFYSYESIPYAEAPIGDLRFEEPKPYTQRWKKTFDATRKPISCLQWDQFKCGIDKLVGREDCLTVNVYKPKRSANTRINDCKTLPVLVLLHGGAFMFGSVNSQHHEPFMRNGRVIVVKIAYRLGPLGFLSTEDNVLPGNYGLKDQLLAMHWIKDNIVYFGGDSSAILMVGFSAGAAALNLHMLRPQFEQFAKAAVSFSGNALNPWVIGRNASARAYALAKTVNCTKVDSSEQIKSCLQKKPSSAIVRAMREFLIFGYNPFTIFGPVIEPFSVQNAMLTESPDQLIRRGQLAPIPWLLSYTAQDGGYNAAELLQKSLRGNELIYELNARWYDIAPYALFYKDRLSTEQLDNYSRTLKQRYLGNKEFSVETYHEVQQMYTDVLFKNGVEQSARLGSKYSRGPIYTYVYDNPADEGGMAAHLAQRKDIPFGTTHGDDFFLIFSNEVREQTMRPDETEIRRKFIEMLVGFVENSNELFFGPCKFVDNMRSKELQLMFITREGCENRNVTYFP